MALLYSLYLRTHLYDYGCTHLRSMPCGCLFVCNKNLAWNLIVIAWLYDWNLIVCIYVFIRLYSIYYALGMSVQAS